MSVMDKEFSWVWDFETDNWGECWITDSRSCTIKLGAKRYAKETELTSSMRDTIAHEIAHTLTHDLRTLAMKAIPETMYDWVNREEHRVVIVLCRFIREAADEYYKDNFGK